MVAGEMEGEAVAKTLWELLAVEIRRCMEVFRQFERCGGSPANLGAPTHTWIQSSLYLHH